MSSLKVFLAGIIVACLVSAPDLHAQGRGQGKAKGHAKQEAGPPGQVKKQTRQGRERGIVIIEDGVDDARVVIRSDRRDDRDRRRVRRDDGRIILRDDRGRVIVIGEGNVDERFRVRRGQGPKFCRTGAGHPVFGRRWCLEKGFGLGARNDVFFDNGRVIFWDDDEAVIVRDRRFRSDRNLWERAFDRVFFWLD